MFNHSQRPNVSYALDAATESIRYVTSRRVLPGEELCIFYGHRLWFDPVDAADRAEPCADPLLSGTPENPWGALPRVDDGDDDNRGEGPSGLDAVVDAFADGDPDEVVPEEELPFKRLKLTPEEEEEEEMDAVRRGERHLAAWMLRFDTAR